MKSVGCRLLLSTLLVFAGMLISADPFSVPVAHAQNGPSVVVARGVQTGTVAFGNSGAAGEVNAAVSAVTLGTAVDATKAFVKCYYTTIRNGADTHPTCELSNTQVTITLGAAAAANTHTTVRWYVVEFEGNVLVQRGLAAFAAAATEPGAALVSLTTPVDCAKSFVLTSERMSTTAGNLDEQWQASATLTGSGGSAPRAACTSGTTSSLELFRGESGNALTVAWQVIQIEGIGVQRGRSCIGPNSVGNCPLVGAGATAGLSQNATIGTVNTAKSFVLTTQRGGTAIGGDEGHYRARTDFSSATELRFTRGDATTAVGDILSLTWEVVTLNDLGRVVRNAFASPSVNLTGASPSANSASFTTVSQARTIPFISWNNDRSSNSDHATTSVSVQVNTTTLTLSHSTGGGTQRLQTIAWQGVEFFGCDTDPTLCHLSVSAISGTTADSASVRISWWPVLYAAGNACFSAGVSPSTCNVMVLRSATAPGGTPPDINPNPMLSNGTNYTTGVLTGGGACTPTNGNDTTPCVVHNGSATASAVVTFATDCWASVAPCPGGTPNLKNDGTTYRYRLYVKGSVGCANAPCWVSLPTSISQVTVTPKIRNGAGGSGLQWVYHHNGGAALNSPIEDTNNKLYVSLASNRIVSIDTSTGTELSLPVVTPGQAMGYPSWWPVDLAGAQTRVVFGDQKGYVTVFDALTGKRLWTRRIHTDPEDATLGNIQAAVVVQAQVFSDTTFKNHYTSTYGYSGDVIFAGTRNITPNMGPNANLNRRNKIYALRATDGSLLWTFDPNNAAGDCNPQQAMDILVGTPWVDYYRNSLYVTSEDGPTAGQNSLWILNTLGPTSPGPANDDCRGTLKNVFGTILDIDFTIWQSYDGGTFYFQTTPNCFMYGYDADTQVDRISDSTVMVSAGCLIKGSIWQDYNKYLLGLRRFYAVTAAGGVWCMDDDGNHTMARCPLGEWPINPIYQHSTGGNSTAAGATPLASGVLGEPHFWLGGGDNSPGDLFGKGTLFQLSTVSGAREKTFTLDSTSTLGDLSMSAAGDALYVGSSSGRVYRVNLSAPFTCPGGPCTYGSLP